MLSLGISSRTRSKLSGDEAPTRVIVTLTLVPRGPLRRLATSSEVMPAADWPSMLVMTSPGWMPARKAGEFLDGIDDDDFAVLLHDEHADTVILAVLVFLHPGVGFGVVEAGVGIEGVQHLRDSAVVDGFVGHIAGEGLSVVLRDDVIDRAEGLEAIAEGGLVLGGLRADLLAEHHTAQRADGKEDDEGEEGATGADGHTDRGSSRAFVRRGGQEKATLQEV